MENEKEQVTTQDDYGLEEQKQEPAAQPAQEQEPTKEEQAQSNEQEQFVLPDTDEIPEKFRGKPITELARSYSELEKTLGRLGSIFGGDKKEEQSNALEELFKEKIKPDMTPVEFAQAVAEVVEQRAREIAQEVAQTQYSQLTEEQRAQQEVEEVTRRYPDLASNETLSAMALGIVQTKGVTLMEAAQEMEKAGVLNPAGQQDVAKQNQNATIEPETQGGATPEPEEDLYGLGGARGEISPGLI